MLVLLHQLHWVHVHLNVRSPAVLYHLIRDAVCAGFLLGVQLLLQLLDLALELSFCIIERYLLGKLLVFLLLNYCSDFSQLLVWLPLVRFCFSNLLRMHRDRLRLDSAFFDVYVKL